MTVDPSIEKAANHAAFPAIDFECRQKSNTSLIGTKNQFGPLFECVGQTVADRGVEKVDGVYIKHVAHPRRQWAPFSVGREVWMDCIQRCVTCF